MRSILCFCIRNGIKFTFAWRIDIFIRNGNGQQIKKNTKMGSQTYFSGIVCSFSAAIVVCENELTFFKKKKKRKQKEQKQIIKCTMKSD